MGDSSRVRLIPNELRVPSNFRFALAMSFGYWNLRSYPLLISLAAVGLHPTHNLLRKYLPD